MLEGLWILSQESSQPQFYIVSADIASQPPSPPNHLVVYPAPSHYQLVVWSLKSKNESSMKQQQQSQIQIGIFSFPQGSWDFQSSVKTGVIFYSSLASPLHQSIIKSSCFLQLGLEFICSSPSPLPLTLVQITALPLLTCPHSPKVGSLFLIFAPLWSIFLKAASVSFKKVTRYVILLEIRWWFPVACRPSMSS